MKDRFGNILLSIASGLFGGVIFLLFFLALHINALISAIIGVAAFVGAALLLTDRGKKSAGGEAADLVKSSLASAGSKLAEIRSLEARIRKPSVKGDLEVLCITFEGIIGEYEKDPNGFKPVLNYYLESTANIAKKYVELSAATVRTPEMEDTAAKCESMFRTISDTLTKQLGDSIEDDMVDLNAEISVLDKTLKTEGLK